MIKPVGREESNGPRLYVLPRRLNDSHRANEQNKLVIRRNAVQNKGYPESRTRVQR